MNTPLLIAFAGLDGSGKSTQIEAIKKRFEDKGLRVKIQHHFDTELGKICQDIIKVSSNAYIRAITFALDEYAQKLDNISDAGYDLILCDRSHYCAIAYSGSQGISEDWIRSLYKHSQTYNLCLYLDISLTTSYSHKGFDDKSPDINERQFSNVRKIYLDLVANGELIKIDAEQEFDKVTDDIERAIWEVVKRCR